MNSTTTAFAAADRDPRNDTMPYGLRDALVYGFDAASWTFLFNEIFVPAFDGDKSPVLYKGSEVYYDVPAGVVVKGSRTASRETDAVMFRSRDSSDEKDFSTAVSASLGVGGVSASTTFSIEKSSQITQQDSLTTTLISQYKSVYEFHRNEAGALTRDFISALDGLPRTYEPGDTANTGKFVSFFQKWGTHYLVHGFFGGNYILNSTITRSAVETKTAQAIKSSIKTSFNEGVVSGTAQSDITSKTASDLKLGSSDMTSTIYWTGGSGGSKESEWEANVDASPALLFDAISLSNSEVAPKFAPIHDLAGGAVQQALEQALKDYLPASRLVEAAIGQVQPVTDPTTPSTALATNHGFAVMCVQESDNHATVMTIGAHLDFDKSSASLGSAIAMTAEGTDNDAHFERASIILPIRRGSYYTTTYGAEFTGDDFVALPASTPASAFIPVAFALGSYQRIPDTYTAPGDGFLVLACEAEPELVGLTSAIQIDPPASAAGVPAASVTVAVSVCNDHTVAFLKTKGSFQPRVASLCVPVAKGSTVSNDAFVFAPLGLRHTFGWIPMTDPGWKFGPVVKVEHGSNPADQDGFIFATLKADQDGARGFLELTAQDASGKSDALYAACSVHNYDKHKRKIIRSTAMLPVAAKRRWTAKITSTYGDIDADIYWMPVSPA